MEFDEEAVMVLNEPPIRMKNSSKNPAINSNYGEVHVIPLSSNDSNHTQVRNINEKIDS